MESTSGKKLYFLKQLRKLIQAEFQMKANATIIVYNPNIFCIDGHSDKLDVNQTKPNFNFIKNDLKLSKNTFIHSFS